MRSSRCIYTMLVRSSYDIQYDTSMSEKEYRSHAFTLSREQVRVYLTDPRGIPYRDISGAIYRSVSKSNFTLFLEVK